MQRHKTDRASRIKGNADSVGLGLRREMLPEFLQAIPDEIDFFEIAPENWMTLGGRLGKQFQALTEQRPFYAHGLSLSIGSPAPIDVEFVRQVKQFLQQHQIKHYSEHLSYCSGFGDKVGHLYDLMPIPFTEEAVKYVVQRIKLVEDILERPLILENVSFYAAPDAQMSELEFVKAVLQESQCQLLLDVNNIYVNSINHGYDAAHYLAQMPTAQIAYLHIAGHYQQEQDLIIDTHGAAVVEPVWQLLAQAYAQHGVLPTLLERDFNLPETSALLTELQHIHHYQTQAKVQRKISVG